MRTHKGPPRASRQVAPSVASAPYRATITSVVSSVLILNITLPATVTSSMACNVVSSKGGLEERNSSSHCDIGLPTPILAPRDNPSASTSPNLTIAASTATCLAVVFVFKRPPAKVVLINVLIVSVASTSAWPSGPTSPTHISRAWGPSTPISLVSSDIVLDVNPPHVDIGPNFILARVVNCCIALIDSAQDLTHHTSLVVLKSAHTDPSRVKNMTTSLPELFTSLIHGELLKSTRGEFVTTSKPLINIPSRPLTHLHRCIW